MKQTEARVQNLKQENNPYEPPAAQSVRTESPERSFRLRPLGPRMIPAVVCFFYGLMLVLGVGVFLVDILINKLRHRVVRDGPTLTPLQSIFLLSSAASFTSAGWFWTRRKWLPAIFLTLARCSGSSHPVSITAIHALIEVGVESS